MLSSLLKVDKQSSRNEQVWIERTSMCSYDGSPGGIHIELTENVGAWKMNE